MDRKQSSGIRLTYLLHQLRSGKISPGQREELMELMVDEHNESLVSEYFNNAWKDLDPGKILFTPAESQQIYDQVILRGGLSGKTVSSIEKTTTLRWKKYLIAACLLAMMFMGGYYTTYLKIPGTGLPVAETAEILPGREKAVLTISNGRKITLDDAPVGLLADGDGFEVRKSEDGTLIYQSSGGRLSNNENVMTHTISTPRGGKYVVVLPDGSRVWLNAASSLRYPVRFNNPERIVELKGEAYFDIKPAYSGQDGGKGLKFRVLSGNQLVEVMGTQFNINSYEDEDTPRTTLLEGSIRISRLGRKSGLRLLPGQQCIPTPEGGFRLVDNVDPDEAIAWKDDLFSFSGMTIYSIMRQLARWYDVDVNYSGRIPNEHLTGYVSRQVPLSRVLLMLEEISGLKFRIDGRSITVSASDKI